MSCLGAFVSILLVVYFGTVIGLYSLCVDDPRLHKAKKYVLYIPWLTLLCILFAFWDGIHLRKNALVKILRSPHKAIIMLSFFAEVVAAEKEKSPKKPPERKAVFDGVVDIFSRNATAYCKFF